MGQPQTPDCASFKMALMQQQQILLHWQRDLFNQSQQYLNNARRFYFICQKTEYDFEKTRQQLHAEQLQLSKFVEELDPVLANIERQLGINAVENKPKQPVETGGTRNIGNPTDKQKLIFQRLLQISTKLDNSLSSQSLVEKKSVELTNQLNQSELREKRLHALAEKLKHLTSEMEDVLISSELNSKSNSKQINQTETELSSDSSKSNLEATAKINKIPSNSSLNDGSLPTRSGPDSEETEKSVNYNAISSGVSHSSNEFQDFLKQAKLDFVEYSDYRKNVQTHLETHGSEKNHKRFTRNYFHFNKSNCEPLNDLLEVLENQLFEFWVKDDKKRSRVAQFSVGVGVQQTEIVSSFDPKAKEEQNLLLSRSRKLIDHERHEPSDLISLSENPSPAVLIVPFCTNFNHLQQSKPPIRPLPPPPVDKRPHNLRTRYEEISKKLKVADLTKASGFNSHHYYLDKLAQVLEAYNKHGIELNDKIELNKYVSIVTAVQQTTDSDSCNRIVDSNGGSGPWLGYGNSPLEATQSAVSALSNSLQNKAITDGLTSSNPSSIYNDGFSVKNNRFATDSVSVIQLVNEFEKKISGKVVDQLACGDGFSFR